MDFGLFWLHDLSHVFIREGIRVWDLILAIKNFVVLRLFVVNLPDTSNLPLILTDQICSPGTECMAAIVIPRRCGGTLSGIAWHPGGAVVIGAQPT